MVQQVINIGTGPNDGTGDPLRTAFYKINQNFSNLFISVVNTDLAFSDNTITTGVKGTTNGNLILSPQGTGSVVVGPTNILYGTTGNITNFQANNVVFTGTVTASSYGFYGSLTGTASAATVAATATYATTAGLAINAQNYSGTALPNVNTIGNLISLNVAIMNVSTINSTANIYATGNITAGIASYVLGNGYYLSGLSVGPASYGNSNAAAYLTTYNGNVLASNVNINGNLALRSGANLVISATGNIISPAGTNANININADGSGDLAIAAATQVWINDPTQATSTQTGAIIVQGGMGIGGNIYSSGNIVTSGNTFGYYATYTANVNAANLLASNDLIVGPLGTVPSTNLTASFVDNSANYTQINIQNIGNGSSTSADIVATANNGNDSAYFVDLGINANNYTNSSFTITYPNDAYLYVANGNIALGTASTGKAIVFHTDGTLLANEAGRITSGRWVVGGTDDATNKLQVTGTARFYSNVTVANITSIGNVTSTFFYGNGSTLTGMYGNAQVAAYLPTYLPTNTANVAAGNLVATGNVGGTYFIGNGSLLTGLYSNIQAAAYLPTYSGNINTGNVNTTGNVNATYFVGSSQYLTGLYSNASVANYLPTYYNNANIAANGVSSTSYVLGYIAINGYTFANLANSTTKSITLYGNVSTLILDNTAGASVSIANVYLPANVNVSDGTKITIGSNITVSTLYIIANDSSVSGNVSSISPTTPYSWHYVKYAPYNGNPIPQQLPGGPRWIRVG
jgi:hypothetical protein